MRRLAVVLAALSNVVAVSATPQRSPQAQPRDISPPGTAQLAGRVTATSGEPLGHVDVAISSSALPGPRVAVTDTRGEYRFTDLKPGRYWLRASKPGFVPLRYGVTDSLDSGREIALRDGGKVTDANFTLPRAGVISGRIFDETGQPVLDAAVRAMRYQIVQGQRRLSAGSRARLTDDLGAFRIFGLLPGSYYVSVVPARHDPKTVDEKEEEGSFAPTYYPGTIDLAEAQAVTVAIGGETSGLSLVLKAVHTIRIRGTVTNSAAVPAAGVQLSAVRRQTGNVFMTELETHTRPDGTFELTNLAPGAYSIQAFLRSTSTAAPEFGATLVDAGANDVDGIAVRTEPGGMVKGRVVLRSDGRGASPAIAPSLVEISARPAARNVRLPVGSTSNARVRPDWTFELRGVWGPRVLRVAGLPSPWALEAITVNGQDVSDAPIEARPGRAMTGVEIVLTTRATEIAGIVERPDTATSAISAIVFPIDRSNLDAQDRRIQIRRVDREGRFWIRGLPPGEYLAVAVPYVWQGEWTDDDFLDRASQSATRVSLSALEHKTVHLTPTLLVR